MMVSESGTASFRSVGLSFGQERPSQRAVHDGPEYRYFCIAVKPGERFCHGSWATALKHALLQEAGELF